MYALERIMPSVVTATYLLNLAAVVSLVCGFGLLAARLCRRGSAPLRHGVLVWTLILTLAAPAAVWIAQRNGLAMIRITVVSRSGIHRTAIADQRLLATFPSPDQPLAGTQKGSEDKGIDGVVFSGRSLSNEGRSATSSVENPASLAWWQMMGCTAALLWAVGIAVTSVRLGWGCVKLFRFCGRLDSLIEPRQKLLVHQAADAVGLRRLPAVFLARSSGVPVSIGLLRPTIVLPKAMPREIDEGQLQAVLLHEMAHLARRDHWVGLGQRVATVLFWWNPLVRWVCYQISDLREEICDNYVVRIQGQGQRLAQILVDLAARVATGPLLPSTIGVLEPRLAGLTGRVS